ncbi:MAG: tRNA lysidine(34) synthetase TilS [Sphingobacteriia bacterium]|nr:MAG: tRNA lysidine(34) synthetase TilS [Sphingobacteriia bacterium]
MSASLDLNKAFQAHWHKTCQEKKWGHSPFLLACSGGVDSMVLAHLLLAAQVPFAVAHMNFQLRGEESTRDANFVRAFAAQHQLPFFYHIPPANQSGAGIQEWARDQRYQWLGTLLEAAEAAGKPFTTILTAHHADDQLETLLFHFFRGTGWEGLQSLPSFHAANKVFRPLLPFSRADVLAYAQAHKIAHVEDSSNAEKKYTRNQIRLELMPCLEKIFPTVRQNLLENQKRFDQQFKMYQWAVAQKLTQLLQVRDNGQTEIPLAQWRALQPLESYTWEIIKPFGFSAKQVAECIKLLAAHPGAQLSSATHQLCKIKNWMVFSPLTKPEPSRLMEGPVGSLSWGDQSLTWERIDLPQQGLLPPPDREWLNADLLAFPLVLRNWRPGDYCYPLGLNKKKKIAKLLGEYKIDALTRSQVKVIECGTKIVAVLGCRIDHRFRCLPQTQKVLEIKFSGTTHSSLPLPKKKTAKDNRS